LRLNITEIQQDLELSQGIDQRFMIFKDEVNNLLKFQPQSCCMAQEYYESYTNDRYFKELIGGLLEGIATGACFWFIKRKSCALVGGSIYSLLIYNHLARQTQTIKSFATTTKDSDIRMLEIIDEIEQTKRIDILFSSGGAGLALSGKMAKEVVVKNKVAITSYIKDVVKTRGMRLFVKKFIDPKYTARRRWMLMDDELKREFVEQTYKTSKSQFLARPEKFSLSSWDPLSSILQVLPQVGTKLALKKSYRFTPLKGFMSKILENPLNKYGYMTTKPLRLVGVSAVIVAQYGALFSLLSVYNQNKIKKRMLLKISTDRRYKRIRESLEKAEDQFRKLKKLTPKILENKEEAVKEHLVNILNINNSEEDQQNVHVDNLYKNLLELDKETFLKRYEYVAILEALALETAQDSYRILIAHFVNNQISFQSPQITQIYFNETETRKILSPIMRNFEIYENKSFWKRPKNFNYYGKSKLDSEDFHKLMRIYHRKQYIIDQIDKGLVEDKLANAQRSYHSIEETFWSDIRTKELVSLYKNKELDLIELKYWLMDDLFIRVKFKEWKALNIHPHKIVEGVKIPITLESLRKETTKEIQKRISPILK
jgi:hypothetical protein